MWIVIRTVPDSLVADATVVATFLTQQDALKAEALLDTDSVYASYDAHELPEPMTYTDWVNSGRARI